MRRTSKELKGLARETLSGRYGIPMFGMLLASLISTIALMPFEPLGAVPSTSKVIIYLLASSIISLITVLFSAGVQKIHLSMVQKTPYHIGMIFSQFKNHPDRFILSTLLLMLLLWLFLIPTVFLAVLTASTESIPLILIACLIPTVCIAYIALRFSFYDLILVEHPDMSAMESLKESARITKGQIGRLLYLSFSFIPLSLLGVFSFGIGLLWIQPYITQTHVNLYLDITGKLDETLNSSSDSQRGAEFDYYA